MGRAVAAFAASLIFTRQLGATGRGEVVFVTNTAGMLALLAGAGTASALIRLRASGRHTVDELYSGALVAGLINAVASSAVFGLVYALWRDTGFAGVDLPAALAVMGLTVPLLLVANVTQVAALDDRLGRVTVATLAGSVVYLAGVVVLAALGLSVGAVITAFAVGAVVPLVALVWPLRVIRPRWSGGGLTRTLLRLSLGANLAAMSVLVLWRIDVLLVKVTLGFAELGRYSAATSVAEIALVLVMSVRWGLLPHHGSDAPRHEVHATVARLVRTGVAAGALLAVVLGVAAGPLLGLLYGDGFRSAGTALAILVPGVIALGLHYPMFDALYAAGRVKVLTVLGCSVCGLEIVLDLWLLGEHGIVVAAAVSTLCYSLLFGACAWLFAGLDGMPLRSVLLVGPADVALLRGALGPARGRAAGVTAPAGDRTVLVDCRWLDRGGPGRLTEHLLSGLAELRPRGRWILWGDVPAELRWPGVEVRPARTDPKAWLGQRAWFEIPRADVVLWPHQYRPLRRTAPVEVGVIYDTIPFRHGRSGLGGRLERAFFRRAASLTDRVVTVSSFSRDCIVSDLHVSADRVSAIALPEDPASSDRIRHLRATVPVGRHVLYVGRFASHKNLERLVRGFARTELASSGGRLVLLGGTDDEVEALLPVAASVAADVVVLGRRGQPELEELLATALAVVQPSLEEGYGLPVQEALAAGIPVAAARAGALPEVAAGRAELFDPYDLDDIARAVDVAASTGTDRRSDHSAVNGLGAAGYARQFLDVVETAVEEA